jgi:uncharacterized alkaline shock family protein YloU
MVNGCDSKLVCRDEEYGNRTKGAAAVSHQNREVRGICIMAQQKGAKSATEKKVSAVRTSDAGNVSIADEVLSLIAYKATIDVDGVASMTGGLMTDLAALVRKGEVPKGVRIAKAGDEVTVEVSVEVEYGKDMTVVAADIQSAVAKALKDMSGIKVAAVNVNVVGVHVSKPPEKRGEPTDEGR